MEDYLMSPTRAFLAAGGLTALVIATVLIAGAQRGAFGLGPDQAATAPATEAAPAGRTVAGSDTVISPALLAHQDEDEDEEEDDDYRPGRRSRSDERSGHRTSGRDHDDDD
jgi:hypothetical protein